MSRYAHYNEFEQVKLKRNRIRTSHHPITQLDAPRAVTTGDRGVIVDVHDVPHPGYEVEFFDAEGRTVDVLTLAEDEIEPWK